MAGCYIYNNGAFNQDDGYFTVSGKGCVELSAMGIAEGEKLVVYEQFGPPCDNLFVPYTLCCAAQELTDTCPKMRICEAGRYYVGVLGVPPDQAAGVDPATYPADIKVYMAEDMEPFHDNGCGCA